MQEWFKARNIWGAAILALSDAEAGRLAKALWQYTMTGELTELSGAEKGIFALILMTLSQDEANNAEISKKRALAGSAGGKQKVANQANAKFATEEEANQANASNKNKNKEIRDKKKDIDILFDRFWSEYPRKEAKQAAKAEFEKLKPTEELLLTMIQAIEKQKQSTQWQENGGQYIPHPRTWLHNKRWEDEVTQTPAKAPSAQQYTQRDYSAEQNEAMQRMLQMAKEGA